MSIPRTKPSNWVSGERLLYTQINQLDGYVSHALDKTRAGDTIDGPIVLDGYASITCDSGSDINFLAGASLILASGSAQSLLGGSSLNMSSGSALNMAGGSAINMAATATITSTEKYKYTSRSITKVMQSPPVNTSAGTIGFSGSVSLGPGDVGQVPISIPNGCTLTGVSIAIDPSNATPGLGGATIPSIVVKARTLSTGAQSSISSITADPTSGASYGSYHRFGITGLAVSINRQTTYYWLEVVNEVGGSAASSVIYMADATFTVTQSDEGAA